MRKPSITIVAMLLLNGCASGPRVYDGVLGYKLDKQAEAIRITYVEEARVPRDLVIGQIAQACARELSVDIASVSLGAIADSAYEQDVGFTVPIPVGMEATANDGKINGGAMQMDNRAAAGRVIMWHEDVGRRLSLQKITALCVVNEAAQGAP